MQGSSLFKTGSPSIFFCLIPVMEDSRKTDFEKHTFFEIYFPTIPHPTSAWSLRREVAKTDGSQKENSVSLVMYKKTTRNKKNRVKNFEHHSDAQNINSVLFVTCSFLTSKSILISVILARYKKAAYKKKNNVEHFEHHSEAQNLNSVFFVTCSSLTSQKLLIPNFCFFFCNF